MVRTGKTEEVGETADERTQASAGSGTDESSAAWFELAFDVEGRHVDAFSSLLAERGHEGCELREGGSEGSQVVIYIKADDLEHAQQSARALAAVMPDIEPVGFRLKTIDERVWTENWRGHFPRLRVGGRIEVLPPWESPSPTRAGLVTIVINPAMAFGTGHHETTAGCLEMLERYLGSGSLVADVGCGSGILAIAAAKLGAKSVRATDNDPEAVNAAVANSVDNRVERTVSVTLTDGPPELVSGEEGFDFLVANIYAARLIDMADALTSRVKRDGLIVLSGIEAQRASLVEGAYAHRGWYVREKLERGEWVTIALSTRAMLGGAHDRP
jgi:ribosomal protein L11 methyltransferase